MNRIFKNNSHWFTSFLFSLTLSLFLVACGGGGGSSSGSSGGSSSGSTSSGGSGSSGANPCNVYNAATPTASNVVNVSIDCAVFGAVNEPFVSITLCSPADPTNCLTIDHILVDTGSVGLRVFAQPQTTAALTTLNLKAPAAYGQAPMNYSTNGVTGVGECLQFVQGNTWGPVLAANVKVGGLTANNVAFQVMGDTNFASAPDSCATTNASGALETTAKSFGANGVIGIGWMLQDCGMACEQASNEDGAYYFNCTSSDGGSCSNIGVAIANQIQNPVSLFSSNTNAVYNNGVILSLGAISSADGQAAFGGTLTFGIATAPANTVLINTYGNFTTTFEGQTYTNSYIDSGSNGIYFSAASNEAIPACTGSISGFYCPTQTLTLAAQITGQTGSTPTADIQFNVANASTLFSYDNAAYNNLAGTATAVPNIGNTFDWGIPFFYGRNVYVNFEDVNGSGAYFGFESQ